MLDDRKTAILSAVVHEYISTAQPVGSSHLVDAPGVGVSSATVRNELAQLEQEGFLVQPHTSAGRIPTDKGYRYFVDNLTTPGPLDSVQTAQIGDFFTAAHGRLEEMLHQTSDLLANLTNSTSLVVGPTPAEVEVRSVQLVPLSSTHATVVVVFSNGAVESSTIELSDGCDDERLADAAAVLAHNLVGKKLSEVTTIDGVENDSVAALAAMARDAVFQVSSDDHVYVGGTSSVAASFDAVEVVRNILHTLEQQFVVVSLVRDVLDRGMSVAIGGEHGVEPLAACSIVVSPVVVEGEHVGSVGVLGPTRMNYPQALATVGLVSERLGTRLEEGS
ncbi:MAG: heat-inducible transcriptional repressor HrcA [Ilumatobacteraceae bacterium]